MSGIKDMHTLLFWLDNTKGANMKKVLRHQRSATKEKTILLKALEEEGFFQLPHLQQVKFEKKAAKH